MAIESVRINGMFILSGFNLEKCKGFLSPRTKKTVRKNEVSVISEV